MTRQELELLTDIDTCSLKKGSEAEFRWQARSTQGKTAIKWGARPEKADEVHSLIGSKKPQRLGNEQAAPRAKIPVDEKNAGRVGDHGKKRER